MLLCNPEYALVDLYVKKLNSHLLEGKKIHPEYKSFETEKDDYIHFQCFEIHSDIQFHSLLFQEVKYEGNLMFSFHKVTNEVYVNRVPYIRFQNMKIPVFTSDIAQIVGEKLRPYIPTSEIKLVFQDPWTLLAIDQTVSDLIPSISNTRNYQLLIDIQDKINLEEERQNRSIAKHHKKLEREDRNKERAISKKRSIYGLDFKDFKTKEDFEQALSGRMIEVFTKKAEHAKGHLACTINKHHAIMLKYKSSLNSEEKLANQLEENIAYIKKQYIPSGGNNKIRSREDEIDYENFAKNGYLIGTIYENHLYNWESPLPYEITREDFTLLFQYIMYIMRLKEQISYYEKIVQNPNQGLVDFPKKRASWSLVMQSPYWVRCGCDYAYQEREVFLLFMIQPGIAHISLDGMKCFISAREFTKKKTDQLVLSSVDMKEFLKAYPCSERRLLIMIPDSLLDRELKQLLLYAEELKVTWLNIVCESFDKYVAVKKAWMQREKHNFTFFINIDPDYYRNFLVNTPNNKVLWHRYDFSSCYPFRRKYRLSLDGQYEIACRLIQKKANGNLDLLEDIMLGSYTSIPSDLQMEYQKLIERQEEGIASQLEEKAKRLILQKQKK